MKKLTTRLKALVSFLEKKVNIHQKAIATIVGVAESTLSTKLANNKEDENLVKKAELQLSLKYNEQKGSYEIIDSKKFQEAVDYAMHGKKIYYINTHWYLYFTEDAFLGRKGIGRVPLHIWEDYMVEIINLPDGDGHERDYRGSFVLDSSESYLIFNLYDSRTNEKCLHIKIAIGLGSVPSLAVGIYSNINESQRLESQNIIVEFKGKGIDAANDMEPFFSSWEDIENDNTIQRDIARFLYGSQNKLRVPNDILKSHSKLTAFFEEYDRKTKSQMLDRKLLELSNGDEGQTYLIYHKNISEPYEIHIRCSYIANTYRVSFRTGNGRNQSWSGQLSRHEKVVFVDLAQEIVFGVQRKVFLQILLTNKNIKECTFFEGVLSGPHNNDQALVSLRVLLFRKEQVPENKLHIQQYFSKFHSNSEIDVSSNNAELSFESFSAISPELAPLQGSWIVYALILGARQKLGENPTSVSKGILEINGSHSIRYKSPSNNKYKEGYIKVKEGDVYLYLEGVKKNLVITACIVKDAWQKLQSFRASYLTVASLGDIASIAATVLLKKCDEDYDKLEPYKIEPTDNEYIKLKEEGILDLLSQTILENSMPHNRQIKE